MKKLFFKNFFFLALAVMQSLNSSAQIWSTPINIDSPKGTYGDNGQYTSMAIVDGNPAMVYYDMSHKNLMYMRANDVDGTTWGDPMIIAETGDVGMYCSLNVVQGKPAVSFFDATNSDLKFVCAMDAVGSTWFPIQTVDNIGIVGKFTSLCEVQGTPAIAYYDESNQGVKYVHAYDPDGNAWGIPITIESGFVGRFVTMCVVAGNPAVAYYHLWFGGLVYSRSYTPSGSAWGGGTILDEKSSNGNINVGEYTSLSVVDGKPAISYFASTSGDLRFISATTPTGIGAWNAPITVDATGLVGKYTSLCVVDGNPAIAYNDDNNALKFVRSTDASGTSWGGPQIIDSVLGQFASLSIVNGNPAVAYHNANAFSKDAKYIRATDVSGTTWGSAQSFDLTGDLGDYTSLAVVSGNPAVSYYDASKGNLKYVRATNDAGTAWGTPQTIDSNNNVGAHTSLAVVNGNPAIAYHYSSNTDFKFMRATDSTGSVWGGQQTIDGSTYSGFYSSLTIVNGNPAVSYYRDISKDLRFARATDASGTSWGTPQDIDVTGDVGGYTSLCIVNGNPAISYYDVTNGDLKYVRSTDVSGSTWGSPFTVDATGDVGKYTSLLIVNGYPTITYHDVTNGDLKMVRASDSTGTTWGSPITIDATGNIGQYTSLSIVYGNPAISYYDVTNGDLKFVKATDVDGTVWGSPVVLASGITTGQYTSMKSLSTGNTGIAYFDGGEKWPMYTTSTLCSPNTGVSIQTACDTYTWIDGNTYTSSNNTATYTLTNVGGCDSTVTLNLTINTSTTGTDVQIACESYTWIDGFPYTSSTNTPTFTIVGGATNGCDSVVTLNLTINTSTTSTDVQVACDEYQWIDGNYYTSSNNTATHALTNAAGCDSIVTLDLTINSPSYSSQNITACSSYTWINGTTYTSSTMATHHLTNSVGCDSTISLFLTINTVDVTVTDNSPMLTSNAPTLGHQYQWIDCNNSNLPISGETYQSFTAASNGDYAVIVTGASGTCTDTSACINITGVGINETTTNNVSIYPNPTNNLLTITLDKMVANTQITVVSIEGKEVYNNNTLTTTKIVVDATDWSKGVYIVKINNNQYNKIVKLIKE